LPTLFAPERGIASATPAAHASLPRQVRIVRGVRDSITPLARGQQLVQLTPGARLPLMSGVGHIPQREDGPAFKALSLTLVTPFWGRPAADQ
jgi:pimeloyl-ACP methyl ester carboxylesterase